MTYQFKRGDTFSLAGTVELYDDDQLVADMTGWNGACQIRGQGSDTLIAQLAFEWVNAAQRMLRLSKPAADTQAWPLGVAEIDVQFTSPGGDVVSTRTETVVIVKDVTRGA